MEDRFTDDQELALRALDASKQAKLRIVMERRMVSIRKLREMDDLEMGSEDESTCEAQWKRYEKLVARIADFEKALYKYNIPFEGKQDKRIQVDVTPIPKLNEWLTEFINTEPNPEENIVNRNVISQYSRPSTEDVLKALEKITETANSNNDKDVLDQIQRHVGDSAEEKAFALKVMSQITSLFKKRGIDNVMSNISTKASKKYNMPVDRFPDEGPSFQTEQPKEPLNYESFSNKIQDAIRVGDLAVDADVEDSIDLDAPGQSDDEISDEECDEDDNEDEEQAGAVTAEGTETNGIVSVELVECPVAKIQVTNQSCNNEAGASVPKSQEEQFANECASEVVDFVLEQYDKNSRKRKAVNEDKEFLDGKRVDLKPENITASEQQNDTRSLESGDDMQSPSVTISEGVEGDHCVIVSPQAAVRKEVLGEVITLDSDDEDDDIICLS